MSKPIVKYGSIMNAAPEDSGPLKLDFSNLNQPFRDMKEEIIDLVDQAIAQGRELSIIDLPLCLVLGYKRYCRFEDAARQDHIERCMACAYLEECPGPDPQYVDRFGDVEFLAVGLKHVISDMEKCMLKILSLENGIGNDRILELAKRFKICSSCDDGSAIFSTGQKLVERGLVTRSFQGGRYIWKLTERREDG